MKRTLLFLAPLALLSGCVVRHVGPGPGYVEPAPVYAPPPPSYSPPPPAPPPARVQYFDQHFIPDEHGGGWCYLDGPHTHEYMPDREDWYEYDRGYWYYRGPFEFSFLGGHPLPGGGWCPFDGPHYHDYFPPRGSDWFWQRGRGWVYQGP